MPLHLGILQTDSVLEDLQPRFGDYPSMFEGLFRAEDPTILLTALVSICLSKRGFFSNAAPRSKNRPKPRGTLAMTWLTDLCSISRRISVVDKGQHPLGKQALVGTLLQALNAGLIDLFSQ